MRTAGSPDHTRRWHTIDSASTAELLGTSPDGLAGDEVRQRLEEHGPNELERERVTPWWRTALHQFTDPLIYLLLIAAVVTLLLRDYTDTGVIVVAVLLNAVIGFTQERRAQRAMRALEDMSAPHAEVVRDGQPREVESRELVPGDVVVLASGDRVPADMRLFHVQELHVDESALTGESQTVAKQVEALSDDDRVPGDQYNIVFSGTIVTRGRGWGYVVRTGTGTELGRIATAVRQVGAATTPLQEKMARFGRQIGLAVLVFSALIGAIGLWRGMAPAEVFLVAIALVVSAIPESLPVVLTVTFAVGVRRMARRNALIRSLPAVETLGSATVIGSDKTGTLTRNEMTVERIWAGGELYSVAGSGYNAEGEVQGDGVERELAPGRPLFCTLVTGALANEADPAFLYGSDPTGDPTELALLAAAARGGIDARGLRSTHRRVEMLPFESERRFMATLNEGPDGHSLYIKGAPEAVIARCARQAGMDGETELDEEEVRHAATGLAGEGLRVLAMAFKQHDGPTLERRALEGGFTLVGLQGMRDPIREEVFQAVRDAHTAGIRVLMLTGDHVATAAAVGRELHLHEEGARAVEGSELSGMPDEELDEVVREVNVYARVAPEHKLRIVERLKAQGQVVAVTGDGVNDAPALRAAHIGIAMGMAGTDVAREASDLVLADDNFATITAAVEEGRVVFANVRKVTFFLLSTSAADVLAILFALLVGWPIPFTAAQILWVNLVTDGLQDMALAFEPPERDLLKRPPRPRDEGVITLRVLERIGVIGLFMGAGTLGMFWWTWSSTGDVDLARTIGMTQLVVFNFFHAFNCRSLDASLLSIPPFTNRFLFASVAGAALAQLAVLHLPFLQSVFRTQPLGMDIWLITLVIGSTAILGGELDKWRNRRRGKPIG